MRACKEIEDTKRDQKEVLKLKSTVTKVKKKIQEVLRADSQQNTL